jgi:hypothetical protein
MPALVSWAPRGFEPLHLRRLIKRRCLFSRGRILRYPPFEEIEKKLNSKIEAVRPGAVRAAAHEVG